MTITCKCTWPSYTSRVSQWVLTANKDGHSFIDKCANKEKSPPSSLYLVLWDFVAKTHSQIVAVFKYTNSTCNSHPMLPGYIWQLVARQQLLIIHSQKQKMALWRLEMEKDNFTRQINHEARMTISQAACEHIACLSNLMHWFLLEEAEYTNV